MIWTWDKRKAADNKRKHGVSFEFASLVFKDPLALTLPDPFAGEDRYRTIGLVGHVCLFVVHTYRIAEEADEETGRIISARVATKRERQAYEEGE